MTAKDARDLQQLRKELNAAVARMVEVRDESAAKAQNKDDSLHEWHEGIADGVGHALYALWAHTGGAHGVDTRPSSAATS